MYKIAPYVTIKDSIIANELMEQGYSIVSLNELVDLDEIYDLYKNSHVFTSGSGGTFWSIYSQDIAYKQKVHDALGKIMGPLLHHYFTNFKTMINAFVVKVVGKNSYMHLHRDTTAMNETLFSPISLWLPLNTVDEDNGALFVVPKSHHLSPLYRAVTIPADYRDIEDICWQYAKKIFLQKGQAVIFDPRILHFSSPNISAENRVAIVSSIFHYSAALQICYLDNSKNEIEIYEQEDKFMIENQKFLINYLDKPAVGKLIKQLPFIDNPLSKPFFTNWCETNNLEKTYFTPVSTSGFPIAEAVNSN